MLTQDFIQLLERNADKALVFEYEAAQYVPAHYHITEIKKQWQTSVDCGGHLHEAQQTVVQLWLPAAQGGGDYLSCAKALSIFSIVQQKIDLNKTAEIYFEYGFGDLKTSVYQVTEVEETAAQVVVKLFVPAPVCKPRVALSLVDSSCGGNSGCC